MRQWYAIALRETWNARAAEGPLRQLRSAVFLSLLLAI